MRYEQVTKAPETCVLEIASFIGVEIPRSSVIRIVEQFSQENVRILLDSIAKLRTTKSGDIIGARNKTRFTTTKNPDGTLRVFDKKTSFQTKHITSNHEREWETVLSETEKERLQALRKDWLHKYDFEL